MVSFLLLFAAYFLMPVVLQGEMIVNIRVEGIRIVYSNLIINASGLEIGEELTPSGVKDAIKQIYETNLFSDVRIEEEKESGGIGIVIWVKEYPIISKVEFSGNKKFKNKKLKEICELEEKGIATSRAIFQGEVNIRKAYEEEGYYLTKIETEVKESDGKVLIKYVIEENKRVKIKSIDIIGNQAFSDRKLKRKFNNRAKKWWWRWSGNFNKDEFEEDPNKLIEFYHDNGYPNCKIIMVDVIPQEDKGWVEIQVEIDEGKKLYFGDVEFFGNLVIEENELVSKLKFDKDDPYSKSKLRQSMEEIYGIYSDLGYLYLNVNPTENLRDSIVDIEYNIREGNPAKVHKIVIKNNQKTHEKVIRRELIIFPGDVFSRKKLIASQRKIFNLGFFKNMSLDTRQVNPEGDIDLIIDVEEKQAGTASLGASYYPSYGIVGNISFSAPNFRGLGERLTVGIEKGEKMENLSFGYTKPWLFDTPITCGLNLFRTWESRYWYRMGRTGGAIHASRPIPGLTFTKGRVSYKLENIETDTVVIMMPQGVRSMTTFGITRDSRDNFLNPTVGTRENISVELAGGILGGKVNYHKEIFDFSTYHKLAWRFVLGFRGKFGIVNGYESSSEVPLYERFILGGIGSWGLRGYKDWTIGPENEDKIMIGRFASIFTVEAKIAFDNNIYPLIFFDAGNAWECLSEANFQDLKRGVGVGFRIEIPMMGLVGFDVGYGIDSDPRGLEFHLQMGGGF